MPRLVTSENVETLLAQGEGVSYAGLALWMLDADAGEIADYWARCPKDGLGGDIERLIFLNWTRLDPQSAVAATSGTDEADMVWWAWAASDPRGALAAAPPEKYHRVAKGIGEFHPAWLMENFSDIPEEAQDEALVGLMTWKENDDPEATLDFLREQGRDFHAFTFKALALKDPWAAFDWLQKNGKLEVSRYSGHDGPVEILIREMQNTHPDDLERMAATLPTGKLKRALDGAVFESQLVSDPEKALEAARKTEAPLISAKRLAMIGASLVSSDPDKAFDIAAEILMKLPGGLSPKREIRSEGNRMSWGAQNGDTEKFFNTLVAKNPERVLDMAATAAGDSPGETLRALSNSWAESDLESYAGWVNRQSAPEVRRMAIETVVNNLAAKGSYAEAGDWALTSPEKSTSLSSLAWRWGRSDPEQARDWFQNADIPEQEKQSLLQQIKSP